MDAILTPLQKQGYATQRPIHGIRFPHLDLGGFQTVGKGNLRNLTGNHRYSLGIGRFAVVDIIIFDSLKHQILTGQKIVGHNRVTLGGISTNEAIIAHAIDIKNSALGGATVRHGLDNLPSTQLGVGYGNSGILTCRNGYMVASGIQTKAFLFTFRCFLQDIFTRQKIRERIGRLVFIQLGSTGPHKILCAIRLYLP